MFCSLLWPDTNAAPHNVFDSLKAFTRLAGHHYDPIQNDRDAAASPQDPTAESGNISENLMYAAELAVPRIRSRARDLVPCIPPSRLTPQLIKL
jgi:hypothetical protein